MNVILFSTADWDNPFWTNKQHMAKTFEKHGHKVIYVDSLGIRKPKVDKRDILRILKRFKSLFKPYKKVSSNIWVVSPFVLPFHKYKIVSKFNDIFLSIVIKILMSFLGFKEFIFWTYSPVTNTIIDKFFAVKKIYHCVDDLSSLPNVDKKILIDKEKELISKSDYIFTTSENLFNYIKPLKKNTYYQNNVCDYEHFSKAKKLEYILPNDIYEIKGYKIIFVGAISSYKVNFELLFTIANNNPSWNIIMIGQIGEGQPDTRIDLLESCKNIYLLGPKNYEDIPKYLHFSDVAIIPSNLNDYTKSMFPMKFFEYLSAGLQVVSTNLISLEKYKSLSYLSSTNEEFEKNLFNVIENKFSRLEENIETECKKHTWDNRYKKMMKIISGDSDEL